MVSLWYPSPLRDPEFLIQGLLLEKDHCLTAQHTAVLGVHEALFVLITLVQKLRPYGVGAHAFRFQSVTRSDVREKKTPHSDPD